RSSSGVIHGRLILAAQPAPVRARDASGGCVARMLLDRGPHDQNALAAVLERPRCAAVAPRPAMRYAPAEAVLDTGSTRGRTARWHILEEHERSYSARTAARAGGPHARLDDAAGGAV